MLAYVCMMFVAIVCIMCLDVWFIMRMVVCVVYDVYS
jgi:hypothetical protein